MIEAYGDLGTNTFHQIIMHRHSDSTYTVLDYRVEFVKLMHESTEFLSEAAAQRAFAVLEHYAQLHSQFQVERVCWCATEGLRRLDSNMQFQNAILNTLHIRIQLISGQEEARLIADSLAACVLPSTAFLGFDIGGGSTELIAQLPGNERIMRSFPMGAAILFKTFHKSDPIQAQEIAEMQAYIHSHLQAFKQLLAAHQQFDFAVGSSGSLDSVLEILHFPQAEAEIFGEQAYADIKRADLIAVKDALIPLDLPARLKVKGLLDKRAEMMPAALILADAILETFEIDSLRVSQFSLLKALVETQYFNQIQACQ